MSEESKPSLKSLSAEELEKKLEKFIDNGMSVESKEAIYGALRFVKRYHRFQAPRHDGPYYNHLLRVALRCLELGTDKPEIIIAALLHGSIKNQAAEIARANPRFTAEPPEFAVGEPRDRKAAYSVLTKMFSPEVVRLVYELTPPDWEFAGYKAKDIPAVKLHYLKIKLHEHADANIIRIAEFYENGMSLEEVQDPEKRKQLYEKYQPRFQLFLEAVEGGYINVHNPKTTIADIESALFTTGSQ